MPPSRSGSVGAVRRGALDVLAPSALAPGALARPPRIAQGASCADRRWKPMPVIQERRARALGRDTGRRAELAEGAARTEALEGVQQQLPGCVATMTNYLQTDERKKKKNAKMLLESCHRPRPHTGGCVRPRHARTIYAHALPCVPAGHYRAIQHFWLFSFSRSMLDDVSRAGAESKSTAVQHAPYAVCSREARNQTRPGPPAKRAEPLSRNGDQFR